MNDEITPLLGLHSSSANSGHDDPLRLYPEPEPVPTLTVKEMDTDDQPRERALKYGIGSLSVPDLWAIILRTGLRGMPITLLCRNIMRDNDNSLLSLERRDIKEIQTTKGIGVTKALQISAVMELIRRYNREQVTEKPVIRSSQTIYDVMKPYIGNLEYEEIWGLFMNQRNQVVSKMKLSTGGSTSSVFDVKRLMKEALLVNAQAMALTHNHPSGQLRPSPQDDNITRKLKNACEMFDIRMIDHVIVTAAGYFSYHDEGKL